MSCLVYHQPKNFSIRKIENLINSAKYNKAHTVQHNTVYRPHRVRLSCRSQQNRTQNPERHQHTKQNDRKSDGTTWKVYGDTHIICMEQGGTWTVTWWRELWWNGHQRKNNQRQVEKKIQNKISNGFNIRRNTQNATLTQHIYTMCKLICAKSRQNKLTDCLAD